MARIHKEGLGNGNFNASLTGGVEQYYRKDYIVSASTKGQFLSPFVFALKNGSEVPDAPAEIRYATKISVFGFLDLSYKNYLYLQVTARNDWSSTLAEAYNSYFYPSANLSYVFSDGIPAIREALPW